MDRQRIWQLPSLPGLSLLRAAYAMQRFPRHTHDFFVIGLNESGINRFWNRGATRYARPGTIGIVHPGEVHTGESAGPGGWTYRGFYPSESFLLELVRDTVSRPLRGVSFPAPVIEDGALARLLLAAHRALESPVDPLLGESHLVSGLIRLVVGHGTAAPRLTRGASSEHVDSARERIHECFARPLTLRELAEHSGVSRYHLLRKFKEETGRPPYTYLLQVRVEHAKRLLRAGTPIARVAADVGFTDQSHLGRHFKRFVGVTPGVYARNMAQ